MSEFDNFFGKLFNTPEELRAYRDRESMEASATIHELADFVRNLRKSELENLRVLISLSAASKEYAYTMCGLIAGVLESKHGICMACNKNHEEMLLPEASKEPGKTVTQDTVHPSDVSEFMGLHELRFPREDEVDAGPDERPVICKNCNMLYQSLEDRMRRVPGIDGCMGCQQKSAHG